MDSYLLRPSIKSLGHSGCEIQLVKKDGYRIQKKSTIPAYNSRLFAQIVKQAGFHDEHLNSPKVYSTWEEDGLLIAEMEYINAADFICYMEVKSTEEVLRLIKMLCDHIKAAAETYQVGIPSKDIISTKLASVREGIKKNPIVTGLASLVPKLETLAEMPLGICHGDLTFSNILVARDGEIFVIDFLDSFIEAPLIDIVKLRQDTYHYWSIRRSHAEFDHTKIEIVFDRFDKIICETFEGTTWWDNYQFFQKLNLCRILPYVKDPEDAQFLEREIKRV